MGQFKINISTTSKKAYIGSIVYNSVPMVLRVYVPEDYYKNHKIRQVLAMLIPIMLTYHVPGLLKLMVASLLLLQHRASTSSRADTADFTCI